MAAKQKEQERPSLGQEFVGVLAACLAVFLFLCLFSFSGMEHQPLSDGNWGGMIGGFTARMLLGFLGVAAFLVPLQLIILAFQLFSPIFTLQRLPYVCLGCTGIVLAGSGLMGTTGIGAIPVFSTTYPGPGYLGRVLAAFLGTFFGGPGSVLIFCTLFLLSIMVALRFSPYFWSRRFAGWLDGLWHHLRSRFVERSEKPLRGQKAKVDQAAEEVVAAEEQHVPRLHEPVRIEETIEEDEGDFQLKPVEKGEYRVPSLTLLDKPESRELSVDREYYLSVSKDLEEILRDFGVQGKVDGISPGPIITTYEFAPAPGVKINRIVALADDLALGLKAESVRIVGSVPGKAALGIEIPNPERQTVFLRDILSNDKFLNSPSKLAIGLGKDVVGNPVIADLAKMPHLLIAGATGSGKSVAVNTIICSILFRATPDEVRLLLIDPKRVELSGYEAIPHLLHPVVVDPKMASRALQWAVREMERRYQLMEEAHVKSVSSYNESAEEKLSLIVIIIDELADLMMISSREVEDAVARLAQMARAAGMHLILATQRPSVDVLTGLIKANFPTRMSFKVFSKVDSRTILDSSGAEHLLGAGDMLFIPPGTAKLQRIHGAYISEKETMRVVTFLKEQGAARYDESVLAIAAEEPAEDGAGAGDMDEKYDEAVALVCETGQASISMVQRRLRIGYNRAARMIELMEKEGIVGPADGSKPREVLVRKTY